MNLTTRLSSRAMALPLAEREIAVMRLLGRLGIVAGQTIRDLLFIDQHSSSSRRVLLSLVERKLCWHANMPNANTDGRLQGRTPRVYGITDDGKQMLDTFGAEPHDGTFERLLARSRQAPAPPSASQLFAETYITDWCASLLDHVRRTPLLAGAHVQRSYAVTGADGEVLQTIGVVIVLAFDPEQKTFDRPVWSIPWLADGGMPPAWRVVRLALEADTGRTPMRSLFEMAQTYQRLTEDGTHKRLLGGTLRPVILTPAPRRARAVAGIWIGAWEDSPALITSQDRTCHPEYGALWGEYKALKTNPLQSATLLGQTLGTVEQWPARIKAWPGLGTGS